MRRRKRGGLPNERPTVDSKSRATSPGSQTEIEGNPEPKRYYSHLPHYFIQHLMLTLTSLVSTTRAEAHPKEFLSCTKSVLNSPANNLRISYPKTRSPTTMKVIAVLLLLLAGLSRTAAFAKQPTSSRPTSSRAATDLSAMKKKMEGGRASSDKVCILTTHEPDVSLQSTSSYHTLFSDASDHFGRPTLSGPPY
jgi:hypothetical protein